MKTTTLSHPTPTSAPTTMSAIVASAAEDRWTETARVGVPQPAPDEVLVAVRAFSVNRGELTLLSRRGAGWRPGQDIAGEVVALGDGVTDVQVGQRVAALVDGGGWAQYAVAPRARLASIPDTVSFEQAAVLPMAGTTALNLVRSVGPLIGRRVLVTGASGGVGGFAVQLLAGSGAQVTALARATHADRLTALGAVAVVGSLDAQIGQFAFALESVGGATLADAIARIEPEGTVVMFGNSSGEPTQIDVFAFIGGHEDARLQTYFSYRHEHEAGAALVTLLDLVSRNKLRAEVGLRASWNETDAILDALAQRRVSGKAVLSIP